MSRCSLGSCSDFALPLCSHGLCEVHHDRSCDHRCYLNAGAPADAPAGTIDAEFEDDAEPASDSEPSTPPPVVPSPSPAPSPAPPPPAPSPVAAFRLLFFPQEGLYLEEVRNDQGSECAYSLLEVVIGTIHQTMPGAYLPLVAFNGAVKTIAPAHPGMAIDVRLLGPRSGERWWFVCRNASGDVKLCVSQEGVP